MVWDFGDGLGVKINLFKNVLAYKSRILTRAQANVLWLLVFFPVAVSRCCCGYVCSSLPLCEGNVAVICLTSGVTGLMKIVTN